MKIQTYHQATSLEEAYWYFSQNANSIIIGGGAWVKQTPKTVDLAIGLDKLGLEGIVETDDAFEIGSMTTLRDIEKNTNIPTLYNGIVAQCIHQIMGVSLRNLATIGGSIMGKFAFSDLMAPLLVVDTILVFHKQGEVLLSDYLNLKDKNKDILVKIMIKKQPGKGYFHKVSSTSLDFSLINVAISVVDKTVKIAVGARPSIAGFAAKASEFLSKQEVITAHLVEEATHIACEELKFGSNHRASAEYRKALAQVYIERGLKEVFELEN
jgi:CO/xanthine dehydrogenase FAD-binding subunit